MSGNIKITTEILASIIMLQGEESTLRDTIGKCMEKLEILSLRRKVLCAENGLPIDGKFKIDIKNCEVITDE